MYKGGKRLRLLAGVLIALLLLSSWYVQHKITQSLKQERAAALGTILDTTHQALLSWYAQQRASAVSWADNPQVVKLAHDLLQLPRKQSVLARSPAQLSLRKILTPVVEARGYQGYFVLSLDQISIASMRNSNLGTANLLSKQPHVINEIAKGIPSLSEPQISDVPLPDSNGELQEGLPTMFVGAPIYNRNAVVIAILVFRINPLGDFSAILQRGSIGNTGESLAFNRHGRLISSSRFEPELRMRGLLSPGSYSMLNTWMRVPTKEAKDRPQYDGYRQSWPLTLAARYATQGMSGMNLQGFTGYYGEQLISAWLWDNTLQFGLATEISKAEAYQTLNIILYTVYGLTAVSIIGIISFLIYLSVSQRKLRESEQQFSTIVEMSDDAIVSVDSNGKIISVNQAALDMFDYRINELLGESMDILLPEGRRAKHLNHLHEFSQSKETVSARDVREHVEGRRKDGTVFPMEASISKQVVAGRMLLTFSGRDISERLRAEQGLRDSERMFRQVFEASEDAILILKDDRFVDCNEATLGMLRAPNRESVLSLHPWELSPQYQPDGRLSEDKAGEMIRLAHERHFHRFEWMHRRIDGEDFPVEVTLTTTQIAGRPYLHVTWNDITERKRDEMSLRENEQLLNILAQYSSDMISVHEPDGVYRFVSPVCEKLLGYRQEEILGHPAREFFHPLDLEKIRESRKKILEENLPDIVTYRIRKKDGTYIWFETASNTVRNADTGEINEIVCVSRDITARIRTEQKEEQLQRQFMHAQKMDALGRLTGGIAHDFNNILASAKGYTELAIMQAEEQKDEKQLEYLNEVFKSTDRAAAVVKQLLAFARGNVSAPTHQLMQDVVQDALTMMRPLLTSRIDIETRLDPEVPPVLVDNVQINQVMLNLCLNARDAMNGEGRISIVVQRTHASGECSSCLGDFDMDAVELSITDTGPGMEPDLVSRIFDPFFTSKEVGKGSGMGLSVVHGIVHDHHGHILVESEVGKGTSFRIYLPLAD